VKNAKNAYLLLLVIAVLIIFCFISLFFVSKSRSFQFFGELLTSIPNDDNKIVLTFDDGPTESTGVILDKLNELDIKATFFSCGAAIYARPEDAKSIIQAGHELGNHSYSHQRMILKSYVFC